MLSLVVMKSWRERILVDHLTALDQTFSAEALPEHFG